MSKLGNHQSAALAALEDRDWTGAQAEGGERKVTVVQSARMPQDLNERLLTEAERLGISPSKLICELVETGLRGLDDNRVVVLRLGDLHRVIDQLVEPAA